MTVISTNKVMTSSSSNSLIGSRALYTVKVENVATTVTELERHGVSLIFGKRGSGRFGRELPIRISGAQFDDWG